MGGPERVDPLGVDVHELGRRPQWHGPTVEHRTAVGRELRDDEPHGAGATRAEVSPLASSAMLS